MVVPNAEDSTAVLAVAAVAAIRASVEQAQVDSAIVAEGEPLVMRAAVAVVVLVLSVEERAMTMAASVAQERRRRSLVPL